MDFEEARKAHASWKVRIKDAIAGRSTEKLDPATIAKDSVCTLGKWIHSDGPKACNAHPDLLKRVKELHAEFHKVTAGVVTSSNSGAKGDALAALGPDSQFSQLSNKINGLLIELEAKCKQSSK